MQKWNIYSLLVILMVSIQNKAAAQQLKLVRTTSFPYYSSASTIQYYNKQLYVVGDDAPYMLVLTKKHKVKDSLRLFNGAQRRIAKDIKADMEASFLSQMGRETFLFLLSSFSDKPRNKVLRVSLKDGKPQKGFETFLRTLETSSETNIEGAVGVNNWVVLSNRANQTQTQNTLLLFKKDERGFAAKQEHTITLQLPARKEVIGISGLEYISSKDILLFTASTELTDNAIDDGEIGKSYLGFITQFSTKLQQKALAADGLLDLTPVLKRETLQKIESVTVEKVKRRKAILHLAADNDDGSSYLFKLRFRLPSVS
jgi:hypothetical protein